MKNTRTNTHASITMNPFASTSLRGAALRGNAFAWDGGHLNAVEPWHVDAMAHAPSVCFADGDDDDDDANKGKDEEKKFSQADLDRLIAKRFKNSEKETSALTKKLEAAEKQNAELAERMSELEAKASGNTGEADAKTLQRLEKQNKQLQDQLKTEQEARTAAEKLANDASKGLKQFRVGQLVQNALAENKAHAKGLPVAVKTMLAECSPEFDEETGELTLTVDGVPFTNTKDAAKRFLESQPYFAEGMGGGSGMVRANGSSGRVSSEQLKNMTSDELLVMGLNNKPAG